MNKATYKNKNIYLYFLREYPKQTITVIFAFICAAIAEMVGIGVVLPIITTIVDSKEHASENILTSNIKSLFAHFGVQNNLGAMLIFMVAAIVIKSLIVFIAMRHVSFVATNISKNLRVNLIHSLMYAKWSYYSSIPIGKISNMLSNESQRAGNCYLLAGKTISSLFQMSVYIFVAFIVSWKITLMAMLFGGFFIFSLKAIVRMARDSGQEMSTSLNKLLSRMGDSLMMVKPIKAMAEEERFTAFLEKDTDDIVKAQKRQYISNQLMQVIYEPVIITVMSIGIYVMITYSGMALAEILLMAFLFYRIMNYANLSQNNYQNTIQNENAVHELIKQTEQAQSMAENVSASHGKKEITLKREIKFDRINLSYGDIDVIKDLSCTVYANQINLIFGHSGVGKSSLIDIITGMNKVSSGNVYIDDHEISDIDIQKWRQKIGYVPQETILLHDSIHKNVTLNDAKYSNEQVFDALEKCGLREFIETLPDGIETSVGERGTSLSGGQKQRITIARSIIRNPDILILDEATTGLDKQSEQIILELIKNLTDSVTIIMISHDPQMKKIAHNIIPLSKD